MINSYLGRNNSFSSMNDASLMFNSMSSTSPRAGPLNPQIQFGQSRARHIGRKLAFWKKKPNSAADVHCAVLHLLKSHEKYHASLKGFADSVRGWADFLSPPSLITTDLLQYQMLDVAVSQWLSTLVDNIMPIIGTERKAQELFSAVAHSLETITNDEKNVRISLRRQTNAERQYFKAMAKESKHESEQLNQERQRLANDVENATVQLRLGCRRELPIRLQQFLNYIEGTEREMSRACQNLGPAAKSDMYTPSDSQSYSPPSISGDFQRTESPDCHINPIHSCIRPLQTSKFPGLAESRGPAPQPTQEPITPPTDNEQNTKENNRQRESFSLELSDLSTGDFVWD